MFSDELIGQAIAIIYHACEEHQNVPETLVVRAVVGHDWHWMGSTGKPS
jgi:hypothetical protein